MSSRAKVLMALAKKASFINTDGDGEIPSKKIREEKRRSPERLIGRSRGPSSNQTPLQKVVKNLFSESDISLAKFTSSTSFNHRQQPKQAFVKRSFLASKNKESFQLPAQTLTNQENVKNWISSLNRNTSNHFSFPSSRKPAYQTLDSETLDVPPAATVLTALVTPSANSSKVPSSRKHPNQILDSETLDVSLAVNELTALVTPPAANSLEVPSSRKPVGLTPDSETWDASVGLNNTTAFVIPSANSLEAESSGIPSQQTFNIPTAVVNQPTLIVISSDNTVEGSAVETFTSLLENANSNEITIDVESLSANEIQQSTPENPKKASRKRSCTPAEWKHNKAKKALNSGEPHFNVKGKFIPGKVLKPACVCRSKCFLRISEEERLAVHNMFYKHLADKRRQWEYIFNHSPTAVKKINTTGRNDSRRSNSRKYYLGVISEDFVEVKRVQVCKTMFTNTLAIGDGVIVTAHKNSCKGTSTPDKRGTHTNRHNKATEAQRENIKAHINSFPRIPSHYVRAKCQREYVQSGLSISKMAELYKEWCDSNGIALKDRGSKHLYRKVFNTEFNIGFFKPKKDQCQLCNMFKNATRRERETELKDKWIAHIKSKEAAYETQRKARKLLTKRRDVAMCTFDLQKVLPCPYTQTSVFFYKNKLSVYNLTVYDVRTHVGKCNIWHEGIAKRGANEIGSCVFDHISESSKEGITEIHSFSDSCSGQNRNRFVYAMLLLAAEMFSMKIRHCFLEPGHTYNEGDSVHATIEKAARSKEIFDLSEWVQLIKTAKVQEPPYKVKLLKRSDIKNFHDLVSKQNWDKDTEGNKITWNKVKVVEAGFHGTGTLGIQYSYDGKQHFLNTSQKRGHPVNLKTYQPPCAYQEKVPVQEKTVKHLQELCRQKHIPVKYHGFYDQVIAGVEPVEDADQDDTQVAEDCEDPDEVVDDDGFMENVDQEDAEEQGLSEEGNSEAEGDESFDLGDE